MDKELGYVYSISVDTGGTFTDVVVSNSVTGEITLGKSLTNYERASIGLMKALENAAANIGTTLLDMLQKTGLLIYGTTRATNALIERKAARTALLVTKGFPDILVLKEGGKFNAHQFDQEFPEPYVPRRATYEIRERINSEGKIVTALDTDDLIRALSDIREKGYQALAVSYLWSTVNSVHEQLTAEIIRKELPDISFTLSHELNPIIREYRRTSATALDASLKPLMQAHLRALADDLEGAGFFGDLLISTSLGGVLHVEEVIERPIFMVRSGPAMAPTAGLVTAKAEKMGENVIVCDTGGTTFDVTLVRDGEPKYTRETWLGPQFTGDCIGMASVDIRSIGAGGGSIAWVDSGGLLRVGPHSAGSNPGPACYGAGGERPTVTDAALVLGYLDPDRFLGGRMQLDLSAAERVVGTLAREMGRPLFDTAAAIMAIANESMVKAIEEITVNEGLDPKESVLVAGGGAAGLGIVPIARELGCSRIVLPKAAGALSAYGAQFSDIVAEFSASSFTRSGDFDFDGINSTLESLKTQLSGFARQLGERGIHDYQISFTCEARYLFQIWEIDIPILFDRFSSVVDVQTFVDAFHTAHERIFAVADRDQQVECLNWRGRLSARLPRPPMAPLTNVAASKVAVPVATRRAYFAGAGKVDLPAYLGGDLSSGQTLAGPAMILEPTTTIILYPSSSARISASGSYIIETLTGKSTGAEVAIPETVEA